jgi:hypothetical protein
MFLFSQFEQLYQLLDGEMVTGDCGLRCQQYCCRAAGAIKYLLPGEAEYFIVNAPDNLEIVDQALFNGYRSRVADLCACTRALRPFCCRIFPFRPLIDPMAQSVVALQRATGAGFDQHCWVREPLPQWRDQAIQAWQLVLDDDDNRNFYARYALYLLLAREHFTVSFSSLLGQVNDRLAELDLVNLWRTAALLFELLGRPPSEWPSVSDILLYPR